MKRLYGLIFIILIFLLGCIRQQKPTEPPKLADIYSVPTGLTLPEDVYFKFHEQKKGHGKSFWIDSADSIYFFGHEDGYHPSCAPWAYIVERVGNLRGPEEFWAMSGFVGGHMTSQDSKQLNKVVKVPKLTNLKSESQWSYVVLPAKFVENYQRVEGKGEGEFGIIPIKDN